MSTDACSPIGDLLVGSCGVKPSFSYLTWYGIVQSAGSSSSAPLESVLMVDLNEVRLGVVMVTLAPSTPLPPESMTLPWSRHWAPPARSPRRRTAARAARVRNVVSSFLPPEGGQRGGAARRFVILSTVTPSWKTDARGPEIPGQVRAVGALGRRQRLEDLAGDPYLPIGMTWMPRASRRSRRRARARSRGPRPSRARRPLGRGASGPGSRAARRRPGPRCEEERLLERQERDEPTRIGMACASGAARKRARASRS
jgi:hypothetical protein